MKASYTAIAKSILLLSGLTTAACVPAPDSTPAPSPSPVVQAPDPAPEPAPPAPQSAPISPEVAFEDWIDRPRTLGDWVYDAARPATSASYSAPDGTVLFRIVCRTDTRQVGMVRFGDAEKNASWAIRTETAQRLLSSQTSSGPSTVELGSRDPLLDAIAVTRGRFAVETQGLPTLYLPAWAEVTRVIEDCR